MAEYFPTRVQNQERMRFFYLNPFSLGWGASNLLDHKILGYRTIMSKRREFRSDRIMIVEMITFKKYLRL